MKFVDKIRGHIKMKFVDISQAEKKYCTTKRK